MAGYGSGWSLCASDKKESCLLLIDVVFAVDPKDRVTLNRNGRILDENRERTSLCRVENGGGEKIDKTAAIIVV